MAMGTTAGATFTSDAAFDTYISGLKNAHALEKQAMQLMERQMERIEKTERGAPSRARPSPGSQGRSDLSPQRAGRG